jgi:enoyl-CoA hydratase
VTDYGDIDFTIEDDVLTIEIGKIDGPTHEGLARIFRDAHHSDAKFVVVTGKGGKFVSPEDYDFDWISTVTTYEAVEDVMRHAEDTLRYSISLDKPMIAKVYAPGAHQLGSSIALACDFVYAANDATFSDPHLSGFGLPPGDGGIVLMPARIGITRAKEFLMTDRVATAAEAVELGLINKAVPAEDLDAEVNALIEKLRSFDYSALRLTKNALNHYQKQNLLTAGQGAVASEAMRFVGKLGAAH